MGHELKRHLPGQMRHVMLAIDGRDYPNYYAPFLLGLGTWAAHPV